MMALFRFTSGCAGGQVSLQGRTSPRACGKHHSFAVGCMVQPCTHEIGFNLFDRSGAPAVPLPPRQGKVFRWYIIDLHKKTEPTTPASTAAPPSVVVPPPAAKHFTKSFTCSGPRGRSGLLHADSCLLPLWISGASGEPASILASPSPSSPCPWLAERSSAPCACARTS